MGDRLRMKFVETLTNKYIKFGWDVESKGRATHESDILEREIDEIAIALREAFVTDEEMIEMVASKLAWIDGYDPNKENPKSWGTKKEMYVGAAKQILEAISDA